MRSRLQTFQSGLYRPLHGRLIALALSLSMIRAGERVGMLGAQAGTGAVQASRMTETLARLLPLPSDLDSPDPLWWEQLPITLVDGRQHDYWRVSESRLRAALQAEPAKSA